MSEAANPASSENIVAEVIDNGEISAQQLLVVGLCLFFNMLDGFDITAMAVVAGAVSTELQLTPDRLGWIFSFALAGMMAGAMPQVDNPQRLPGRCVHHPHGERQLAA
jgi:hypothetical protein